jgi:S-adenosylmethionine:tRNA ribosyltransferase-isomerase
MHPRELRIEDYTYELPDERITKYPFEERDASKLLIYNKGLFEEDNYRNVANYIQAETLLVFNQTKVVHARLLFKKATGGVIEVFCLEPGDQYPDIHTAMLQKRKVQWKCMIGGASKWKHGAVLQLEHREPDFTLSASIIDRTSSTYILELQWDKVDLSFAEILHYAGAVPLPPYLHREVEKSDEERYQTIFAKEEGSVAAPTAGLHFTESVLNSLQQKGVDTCFVTLHVGAGTFKPVKSETMEEHEMHAEWMEMSIDTLEKIIRHLDKGIVAVGTTSLRTLESLYWIGLKILNKLEIDLAGIAVSQWEPYEINANAKPKVALEAIADYLRQNKQQRIVTRTQILIAPGYDFKMIKGLITNFHQPQSTLLLLVAALVGDAWKNVYNYALEHEYRFLSYGDGCLLWKG